MGSAQKGPHQWRSVFDGVKLKTIPSMPEALMAEINTAICNLEYARATVLLETPIFFFFFFLLLILFEPEERELSSAPIRCPKGRSSLQGRLCSPGCWEARRGSSLFECQLHKPTN
ncbi:hypothetical protein M0R45_011997 [Rubus argutus]|uniref:Uncharacterized protein n=1 Tax=Rubus argutus TaxID=59490 RepID=A0AAW1YCT4_RUBAR